MPYRTTMTGSWYRPPEVLALLAQSPTGEIPVAHEATYLDAERAAIRDQLHPGARCSGSTRFRPVSSGWPVTPFTCPNGSRASRGPNGWRCPFRRS